jgi:hypothetical protein
MRTTLARHRKLLVKLTLTTEKSGKSDWARAAGSDANHATFEHRT